MELEVTAMACLQLQMSEVPAGIWEHQTKGMVDVNFRVWKVIEHSIFNRLQMGNMVGEAGDIMTEYFDSSDSAGGMRRSLKDFCTNLIWFLK